ncbi:MAG: L,D-transpeptidase family protein [Gammaproteobacteria bacterium]
MLLCIAVCSGIARADTYIQPPDDTDLIGSLQYVKAHQNETLLDIARNNDVGQEEIIIANRDVDRWLPVNNPVVRLPKRYVLPNVARTGLVLNLPEMRLYYFYRSKLNNTPQIITHPVSVGRMDWETPLGSTRIASKQRDPSWRPPQSLKDEAIAEGDDPLPDVVPPGPDNPLGGYAMRLAVPGYLLHSTNKPYGVGMRVTHGCLRMYPEDIERLFDDVPVGTPVEIVNQPVKLGWLADTLYIEIHPALEEDRQKPGNDLEALFRMVAEFTADRPITLNHNALRQAFKRQDGIPVAISE